MSKVVDSLNIPGGDLDISLAAVDSSYIIITIASKKQVQLIQVLPSLKKGRTIDVNVTCRNIAVADGKLFVLCETTDKKYGIRVYDLAGRDLRKGHTINLKDFNRFISPTDVAASRSGNKIFITDIDTNKVSCLTSDGNILCQNRYDGLEHPFGLFVDGKDNVIVCGDYSNTIHVLSAAGQTNKALLSSKDGISNPISVTYRPNDGILAVGCWDSNFLLVFRVW